MLDSSETTGLEWTLQSAVFVSRKGSEHGRISDWTGKNPMMTSPRLKTTACLHGPPSDISAKDKHNLHIRALACARFRWVQIWNGITQFPLAADTIYPSISTAPWRRAFPPPRHQSSHSYALWKWEEKLHFSSSIPSTYLSLIIHPSICARIRSSHSVRSFIKIYLNWYEARAYAGRFHGWQVSKYQGCSSSLTRAHRQLIQTTGGQVSMSVCV